jgi:hypothetical protein
MAVIGTERSTFGCGSCFAGDKRPVIRPIPASIADVAKASALDRRSKVPPPIRSFLASIPHLAAEYRSGPHSEC